MTAWRKVIAWWTLANLSTVGTLALGLSGTVAALAAANFFFFTPHVPRPAVFPSVIVDAHEVGSIYQPRSIPGVVTMVEDDFAPKRVSPSPSQYDSAAQLVRDCVLYRDDVDTLNAKACESLSPPAVDYPEYIHDLITKNGTFDSAAKEDFLRALAQSRPAPLGSVAAGEATIAAQPPPETRQLSGDDLVFAYMALRDGARAIDVVSVRNSGHVDATDVTISAPGGLEPLYQRDTGPFDLQPGQSRSRLYWRPAAASGPIAAGSETLPTEGFEVSSRAGDTFVSQQWAGRLLVGVVVVIVVTMVNDIRRTPTR
jgi:hypothetical protein